MNLCCYICGSFVRSAYWFTCREHFPICQTTADAITEETFPSPRHAQSTTGASSFVPLLRNCWLSDGYDNSQCNSVFSRIHTTTVAVPFILTSPVLTATTWPRLHNTVCSSSPGQMSVWRHLSQLISNTHWFTSRVFMKINKHKNTGAGYFNIAAQVSSNIHSILPLLSSFLTCKNQQIIIIRWSVSVSRLVLTNNLPLS